MDVLTKVLLVQKCQDLRTKRIYQKQLCRKACEALLTFPLAGYEQVVEVVDHPPRVEVRVLTDRLRDTYSRRRMQSGHPLAVHVDTVLDRFMFLERQRKTEADDVHAPNDLKESLSKVKFGNFSNRHQA